MNRKNIWLLPEGIEEILPPRAFQLEHLCRELIDLFTVWGYEIVIPPMVEYLDSLLTGTGGYLDLQTFKLTDQLNGRLMGLRADITPQVARIDAHILKRDIPVRLCYFGPVLHTKPSKSGDTRSPLQLGAELYGHAGISSDIEIVRLMLATLKHVGVKDLYFDIGHIGIFRCLSNNIPLSDEQLNNLFDALQRKSKEDIVILFDKWKINNSVSKAIVSLIDMNGDISILEEAKKTLSNISEDIIIYIKEIYDLVKVVQEYSDIKINIDLAELRGYHYHTGMIYTIYTKGKGSGIAFGGRYDDIGRAFGRARPATGFSLDVKSLLKFYLNKKIPSKIFAPLSCQEDLLDKITELRSSGNIVISQLEGQKQKAKDMLCDKELIYKKGKWVVVDVN